MRVGLFLIPILFSQFTFANDILNNCNLSLKKLARNISANGIITEHYGGVETLGGFTTIDTSRILTPLVGNVLLKEFLLLHQGEQSKPQIAYPITKIQKKTGPVASFMRAHRDLTSRLLGKKWDWQASSLLLVSTDLQNEHHQHLSEEEKADTNHPVTRANGVASLRTQGTIFRTPSGAQNEYFTSPGETAVFNEGTWHMSPLGAKKRLFLMHFFEKDKRR